jgi:hypothetical protein
MIHKLVVSRSGISCHIHSEHYADQIREQTILTGPMHRIIPKDNPLLPEETLVERKLLALEDVAVTATALAGARRHNGEDTTGLELLLERVLDLAGCLEAVGLLLLDAVGLLLLLLLAGLGLAPSAKGLAVVGLEPLSEGGGIDLNDGRLGEGVGADKLVVGGVVDDTNDTALLSDALRAPREVARVETQSTELAVSAAGADKMDTLSANTGVGRLATLLESPAAMLDMTLEAIGLCIPLLAVVCALRTGRGALVTGVTRDTGSCQLVLLIQWGRVDTPYLRLFRSAAK